MTCFLAQFSDKPCEGRLIKAHLLPRQLLKREGFQSYIDDPRGWVWACGGAMGDSGHHGAFDTARTLRVPRQSLPAGLERLALDLGLDWYLHREYGPVCELCGDSEVVYVNPGYPDPQTETDYPCPKCSRKAA